LKRLAVEKCEWEMICSLNVPHTFSLILFHSAGNPLRVAPEEDKHKRKKEETQSRKAKAVLHEI